MDRQRFHMSVRSLLLLSVWFVTLLGVPATGRAASSTTVTPEVIHVACPACGQTLTLGADDRTPACSCGEQIDAAAIWERRTARLDKYAEANPDRIAQQGCLACHRDIRVINAKMAFIRNIGGPGKGCVVCHEGDADAARRDAAHQGMIRNPADLWECSKGRGCAKCHSRNPSVIDVMSTATDPLGQRFHVYRVERSLMSTQMGILNNALAANGLIPIGTRPYANFDCDDPLGPVPLTGTQTYARWVAEAIAQGCIDRREHASQLPTSEQARERWGLPKAMMVDYYRKECARCHNWGAGKNQRGDRRGAGCASCHVPYSNDAYYEGTDEVLSRDEIRKPLRHEITIAPGSVMCTRCHTRGKRIGTSYEGLMESPFQSPWRKDGHGQMKLHGKRYIAVGCDVHRSHELECADCHTSIDVHGDGNIYPTTDHAVEIECTDCHGTTNEYPWELPVGYGDCLVREPNQPRGLLNLTGTAYLLTARGNPFGNVLRQQDRAQLMDKQGRLHEIPLLKTLNQSPEWNQDKPGIAMARIPHTRTLECYACHSPWIAQCYGCHLKVDYSGQTTGGQRVQQDWLARADQRDDRGYEIPVLTPGRVEETRSFERWEHPMLVRNKDNRIAPGTTGCQVLATCVDEQGNIVALNQHFVSSQNLPGLAINPAQPHTIQREARSCESCHVDPQAMGYGIDVGRFARLDRHVPGDVPGAQKTTDQILPTSFPHDPSVLLTPDGRQRQTMTYAPPVGPLTEADRHKLDRRGTCLSCHRYYGTARWDAIRAQHGQAHNTETHNRILEDLLGSAEDSP